MAGFGGGMSGAGAGWMEDAFKDMRQDMWDERAYYQRGVDRQNAVEDAKLAYQRNLDAYGSRYQMTMADMAKAGLNPILAASQGVGGVPSAQPASQTTASFPHKQGSGGKSAGVEAFAQAASAQQSIAQAELTTAQTGLVGAQTRQVETQTNTERERPEQVRTDTAKSRQSIDESVAMTNRLIQDAKTGAATAANVQQQTKNLQELVPQIRATVDLVKADTRLRGEQTKVAALESALKDLERIARLAEQPRFLQDQSVHDSFVGSLSAVIRALTGLGAHVSIGK